MKFSTRGEVTQMLNLKYTTEEKEHIQLFENPAEMSHRFDCSNDMDLVDFFKAIYQGSLDLTINDSVNGLKIAYGEVQLRKNMRQKRESTSLAYKVPLFVPNTSMFTEEQSFGSIFILVTIDSEFVNQQIIK